MDLSFLSQADAVTLKLELARAAFESAKTSLDLAKQAYDAFLTQADEQGIPRAKLKKLAEDRVQALLESGILSTMGYGEIPSASEGKRERPRKAARKSEAEALTEAEGSDVFPGKALVEAQPEMSA